MTRAELTRMKSLITESEMDSWFGIIPGEELDLLLNKARTFLGKWGKLWNRWMSKNHLKILLAIIQSKKFDFEVMINEVDITAQERFEALDKQYRQQDPAPDRENNRKAFLDWDLKRLRTIENQVLKEVVYQIPETYRGHDINQKDAEADSPVSASFFKAQANNGTFLETQSKFTSQKESPSATNLSIKDKLPETRFTALNKADRLHISTAPPYFSPDISPWGAVESHYELCNGVFRVFYAVTWRDYDSY